MRLKVLFANLVWYYHNEPWVFDRWVRATEDMWTLPFSRNMTKRRSDWLRKSGQFAPEGDVIEAISRILETDEYHKLMFLLGNGHYKQEGV